MRNNNLIQLAKSVSIVIMKYKLTSIAAKQNEK